MEYSERAILQCVGCWAGDTYLRYTVLTSLNKGETAVHCRDPALSVLVMLVVSKRFSSLAVFLSLCNFFWLVSSVYRMRSLSCSFGNVGKTSEFWLGNDNIHLLTVNRSIRLRVELVSW